MGLRSLAAGLLAVAACTASSEEVQPAPESIFFPTGLAISPDDARLFIASANSDLRFDSGTIEVADLGAVSQVVAAWKAARTVPQGCTPPTDGTDALQCDPEDFLIDGAGVRIGNFAAGIGVQDLGAGNLRLIVPVRGDPSVTFVDWNGSELACGGGQGFELCADANRLSRLRGDEDLPVIPDEPYGVYVDSVSQYAVVTHLATGTVTLVDSPAAGTPVLADALTGLFAPNSGNQRGATGVAGRLPGPDNVIYVQSRTEDRIQTLTVARPEGGLPYLVPGAYFFLDSVGGGGGGGGSDDSRGITFDATGGRAYMINRAPPSVQVYDTTPGPTGAPQNRLLGASDVCREASSVVAGDGGGGERVFVSCFNAGQVYVVDPRATTRVETVTTVGRGPFALAVAPSRQLLFVTNFLEDSVAVIDLDPTAPTQYRVILRIGARS